jgi:hypothetical protein
MSELTQSQRGYPKAMRPLLLFRHDGPPKAAAVAHLASFLFTLIPPQEIAVSLSRARLFSSARFKNH